MCCIGWAVTKRRPGWIVSQRPGWCASRTSTIGVNELLLNLTNAQFLGKHTNMNRSCSEDPATDFLWFSPWLLSEGTWIFHSVTQPASRSPAGTTCALAGIKILQGPAIIIPLPGVLWYVNYSSHIIIITWLSCLICLYNHIKIISLQPLKPLEKEII